MTVSHCPVRGCRKPKGEDHMLCRGHWAMLPSGLKRQIFVHFAWRKGLDQLPDYWWAREQALAFCEERAADPDRVTRLIDALA